MVISLDQTVYTESARHVQESLGGRDRVLAYSHNDEMQGDNALTLALSLGYDAIEVDTWLGKTDHSHPIAHSSGSSPSDTLTLVTGHEKKDVIGKTLKDQYLDPLMRILDERSSDSDGTDGLVGIHTDRPGATLYLLIDMKSDGEATWPYLLDLLQPFLTRSYLTTHSPDTGLKIGPLTIIGTGNTPIPAVYHMSPRYIFYDAPLLTLHQNITIPSTSFGPQATFSWSSEIAPMASSRFPFLWHGGISGLFSKAVGRRLNGYADEARSRGIQSRWWGSIRASSAVRRRVWGMQVEAGTSWINADDLVDAMSWLRGLDRR